MARCSLLLALCWLALALAHAGEAEDPQGLMEPLDPSYTEGSGKEYIFIGDWGRCTTLYETGGKLQRMKPEGKRSNPLVHRPHIGVQRRLVQCRAGDASVVDSSFCGQSFFWVGETRICIPRENCTVGEWGPWKTRHDGSMVRNRRVKRLPQADGEDCPLIQEIKFPQDEPSAHWTVGPWGECKVAVEQTGIPLPPDDDDDAPIDDAIYEDDDPDVTDKDSSLASCGGGIQRREPICVHADGRKLHPVLCQHTPIPTLVQPCEVPCPRDCEVGEWSAWEPCQPLDGCPLYPVQQLTTTGYSVRRRRVLSAASNGGAPCPPLEEKRSCPDPRCASWQSLPWGSCELNQPHAGCGPGRRTREMRCVGHDGKEAERAWCNASGAPARSERCRIACAGDCVVSSWGPWSPCSAPCATNHTRPTTTRRRHILAHAAPDGWPCPSEEQLIQTESCNTHACATYSWLATPWGPCRPHTNYQPAKNYTELEDGEATQDAIEEGDGEEEPCIEEGEMTRDVMCVQNNADVVKEALCTPLHRPMSRRACTIRCHRGCRVEAWQPWSPCPNSCTAEPAQQVRRRKVEGGPNCGALQESRTCPEPQDCTERATWVVGNWSRCYIPAGDKRGYGYNIRSIWCGSKNHPVALANCISQRMPLSIQPCYVYTDPEPVPVTCQEICSNPQVFLDEYDPENPTDCVCQGMSLELLPMEETGSDCILPPGMECGEGRTLRAARCLKFGRYAPMVMCKKFYPLSGPNRIKKRAYLGYTYDKQFPSLLSKSCTVPCARDCVFAAWEQWGPCVAEQGAKDAFRFRSRQIIEEGTAGGRECEPAIQRATCRVPEPRWELGEWEACAPKHALCGRATANRTVTCVDENGKKIEESICESLGPVPARETSCRAPCPDDCVVGPWSQWSPCTQTKLGYRRDRTRLILRPAMPGGEPCPHLVAAEPCSVHNYSWHLGEWDDCQPLGGSPCGEGVKKRSVRCLRDDGVLVNDSFCPNVSGSETSQSWCYVPCGVDCELGQWGAWNESNCVCNDDSPKRHHIIRTRTHMTSAVWPGRACPATEQRVPCPQEPCLKLVNDMSDLGCTLTPMGPTAVIRDTAVKWIKTGKRTGKSVTISIERRAPSLEVTDGPVRSVCGWGATIGLTRCMINNKPWYMNPHHCTPLLPGRIVVAPLRAKENEACMVDCGCKDKDAPPQMPGPWGKWGPCRKGTRSRIRQHMQLQSAAATKAMNSPRDVKIIGPTTIENETQLCLYNMLQPIVRVVSIEWANCSESEAPIIRQHKWNGPVYNEYIEGTASMIFVVWMCSVVVLVYGVYMIYIGVLRFLQSRQFKSITKV